MSTTDQASTAPGATTDREIVISRRIDAPRELVFEAFTEARHLAHWWGPEGFTTTTEAFEFRVGGEWVFAMRGPDGTDYSEWIVWTAIDRPERITFRHGAFRDDPDAFESAITFDQDGDATVLEMRTVFPTREQRDEAVHTYHAVEAGGQTLAHLAGYVADVLSQEVGER
ncbi:SRPBCC family protein [Leifsonia sp. TF02-11]|uniref:SRPBCC family protein n=1 Tax=Leifsonia sp. TF02-11 TaxID=2815212 RepID=UPI001AA1167D|nr:SRPBCC family protein [Leifsonia sp. TF02-11]MBO1738238.1 SRPBCC family protein [Leifsonia sp. TF02-11]